MMPGEPEVPGEFGVSAELELHVTAPAAGGDSIARHEGRVVFVSGAIPGETVRARVTEAKAKLLRAEVTVVLDPSPHRVPDRRRALGASGVGGIEFAHVELAHARRLKQQAAADQFTRLGRLDSVPEVHAAPREAAGGTGLGWRTRVQLAIDAAGRPGMFAARSHDIVPVERLPLAVWALNALGLHRLSLPGLTRLELAAGRDGGAVVAHGMLTGAVQQTLLSTLAQAPGEWSLLVRDRGGSRNRGGRASGSVRTVSGSGRVTERVPGIDREFRLAGDGFWQVHADAAAELSRRVVAATAGSRTVLDLYCGAGLFSVAIAEAHDAAVTGIEGSQRAIEDARDNATGLPACFDVARIEKLHSLPPADTVVLDPPRAGVGQAVTRLLRDSSAERIVYVSCDGATFARDAKALVDGGFRLRSTEALDLFPLTAHLEFVSVFQRSAGVFQQRHMRRRPLPVGMRTPRQVGRGAVVRRRMDRRPAIQA